MVCPKDFRSENGNYRGQSVPCTEIPSHAASLCAVWAPRLHLLLEALQKVRDAGGPELNPEI